MPGRGDRERGQAFTLEAVSAGVILLASVLFALQVTAVTPLTASTSSQHIENQQDATAEGVLAGAVENGSLVETLLYWNETGQVHWDSSFRGTYSVGGPPTDFGGTLNRTFLDRGIAFNLNVYYLQGDDRRRHRIVDFGVPSDNAVTAFRLVTLWDDDVLYARDGAPTDVTLSATDDYFVDRDTAPDSPVYAVVRVEVVVWRM